MKQTRIAARWIALWGIFLVLTLFLLPQASAESNYYWLSSNDKYSKFYDSTSVTITHDTAVNHGRIATEITAWTKTSYSYEGAKETIAAYSDDGMQSLIPDPAKLSYSLALVTINPQNRELHYDKERFYDAKGNLLWEKTTPGPIKEITSQEFDETFYDAIVDHVFGAGEMERAKANDRWLTLYEDVNLDGIRTHAQEDTTTIRMKGHQLIGWQWITTKDRDGNLLDIKFQKTAVNLVEGTQRIVSAKYWAQGDQGFKDATNNLDSQYYMIAPRSLEAKGLSVLRDYARTHDTWVHRYSIEE